MSVGLGPGSVVGDLYALARCDYIMGPPSTYTQWASFYGNHPMLSLDSGDQRIERTNSRFRTCKSFPNRQLKDVGDDARSF